MTHTMGSDPLHRIEANQWNELKDAFKNKWPQGITGYYALDTLEKWIQMGVDYGFEVLNPFGEPNNGMIAVLKNELDFIEMLIECPQDTSALEESLKTTTLIDWRKNIVVLFPQANVVDGLKRIANDINMNVKWVHVLKMYVLDKETPLFKVSLPEGFAFKLLTEKLINFVDSKWPHRYHGSCKYFQLLIRSHSGYGLFKEDQLVSWGFIKETGALGHIYTLEEHRKKGYGAILTKLICNEILKAKKDVPSFIKEENVASFKMHSKLGFQDLLEVYSVKLERKVCTL